MATVEALKDNCCHGFKLNLSKSISFLYVHTNTSEQLLQYCPKSFFLIR